MAELSLRESIKEVQTLFNLNYYSRNTALKSGNFCMFKYDAKNKKAVYDKTPFVLVLRSSSSYTLGLNLHWCSYDLRMKFAELIIKANKENIRLGKKLTIDYRDVKPILFRLGMMSVVRVYLNYRISKSVVIVPHNKLLNALKIKSETFSRISPNILYEMARKGKI